MASSPNHTYEFLVSFEAHVISSRKNYNEKQKKEQKYLRMNMQYYESFSSYLRVDSWLNLHACHV